MAQDTILAFADSLKALAGGAQRVRFDPVPALVAVLGMVWYTYIRFRDVRRRPGQERLAFRDYALDSSRMGALVLSLTLLGLWIINLPVPLLGAMVAAAVRAAGAEDLANKIASMDRLREFIPYSLATGLAVGYMVQSLALELAKKVGPLRRAFGIRMQRTSTGDLTIGEPMPAVPPPPGFDDATPEKKDPP